MAKTKFQRPTGMPDILPEGQKYFQKIYLAAEQLFSFYGLKRIDTPLLEDTALYEKGTGLSTDIVQKQMFSLKTRGGDLLTLRPEFTPGLVRAYLEHGLQVLPQPVKLYSFGPVFRYEHPQAGRFRQFNQLDLEMIGDGDAVLDAQTIQIFYNLLKELKFKKLIVEINSIGDNQCRPYYKKLLTSYFRSREAALCPDCRRRLKDNPLRVLDCKEEKCRREVSQAPQIIDHLCEECHKHFKSVLEFLDEIELPYRLNPYLVRGLDYYTKTVFEIFEDTDEGRSVGTLAAGGRYDGLVKLLGGEDTKAVGGALGVERVVALLKERGLEGHKEGGQAQVFLAQLGGMAKRKTLKLLEDFRQVKVRAAESLSKDSLKSQLKAADKLGARYTLLLGQREALEGTIIVRDMQNGRQETVKLDKVVKEVQKKLKK
jgi:histidyl-tRNA synthetase